MNSDGKSLPPNRISSSNQPLFRDGWRYFTSLESDQTIRIVDFGCGKAYLTFALYHFLKATKGYHVQMVGLDLKKMSSSFVKPSSTTRLWRWLAFPSWRHQHVTQSAALIWLFPCMPATQPPMQLWKKPFIGTPKWFFAFLLPAWSAASDWAGFLKPMLKHGILKERFAALATDAARAQLWMFWAIKPRLWNSSTWSIHPKPAHPSSQAIESRRRESRLGILSDVQKTLNIFPSLERRLQSELSGI